MSARPGLCGGHRATGVPTAISEPLIERYRLISSTIRKLESARDRERTGVSRNCLPKVLDQHEVAADSSDCG